jgi:hypothetical protein
MTATETATSANQTAGIPWRSPALIAGLSALAPNRLRAGVMSLQTTTVGYQSTLLGASVVATVFTAVLAAAPLEV